MSTPRSLTIADNQTLTRLIEQAQRRIVYMAPALSEQVGQALAAQWRALEPDAVTVIVDVGPEAYRLGYGSFDALKQLQLAAAELGGIVTQQPGVRLGLLITDDETLVWAPHAELIEAGPDRPEAPNAIRIGLPPADVESDLGQGPDGTTTRTVGLDAADKEKIEEVDQSLKISPPQKFDVVRQVRVFNAFFEFVEFRLSNVLIERKTAQLPPDLMGITDKSTREKLHAAFRLLDPKDEELSGQKLIDDRNLIEKRHLKRIAGQGRVIKRADKEAFEADVAKLEQAIEDFRKELDGKLQAKIDKSRDALKDALLSAVEKSPPERWKESCLFGDTSAAEFLDQELRLAFRDAAQIVKGMKLIRNYKAVTYESLKNEDFMAAARKVFPELDSLYTERHVAAPVASSEEEKETV